MNAPHPPHGAHTASPPTHHDPQPATHAVVVVGVAVMATMLMLAVYFWAAIWAIGKLKPPDRFVVLFNDYLSTERVITAAIAAIIFSAITWTAGIFIVRRT